jgi:hypothetical protein
MTQVMRNLLLSLVLVAACNSSSRGTPDASSPGDGGDGDGGHPGAVCGGLAHATCGATEFCDYPDNGCGVGDQTGTCKPRPGACPLNVAIIATPTCACDGKIYNGDCDASAHGVDLNAHGTCDIAATRFACGYAVCDLANQYCRREPHLGGAAESFTCVPLSCAATPSCACLAKERCGNACTGDVKVGLTLTCSPSA